MAKINKRTQSSAEKLLAKFAAAGLGDLEEMKIQVAPALNSEEDLHYQAQAVMNFYRARIEPFIGTVKDNGRVRNETEAEFDARYREWRFKECSNCHLEFAYAYAFDGVGTCSLECAEAELAKIGVKFSRHHDLKRRWGFHYHPAIVSGNALEVLRTLYENDVEHAFSHVESERPTLLLHRAKQRMSDKSQEQDTQDNILLTS